MGYSYCVARAAAKTVNVKKKEIGGLVRRLPDRIASGDREPNTNSVDAVFWDKKGKRRRILKPLGSEDDPGRK